ncbi:MAG: ribulokinase [Anaerolineales bacterium]|nr:ribulokinase [Anaerolineales bacterium]
MQNDLVIGVDFGTDSVRAIVVDPRNNEVLGEDESYYPRWRDGRYCEPKHNQFRQHPRDYTEGLEACVRGAVKNAGGSAGKYVKGIAVDATGSTPCPVNQDGVPLALLAGFEDNPNAMFHLWKDHTAIQEAEEINHAAAAWGGEDYTRFQGKYSSEWFWAKILHTIRTDGQVKQAAWSWVEHCDWIPALLTGQTAPLTMYRSACAAGHKALWHSEFGGLPAREFLAQLDPYLATVRDHYGGPPQTADTRVGTMTAEWAARLGLSPHVIVGGSSFDAHAGAVGAGIAPHILVKVVGTSTVDMLIEHYEKLKGKDLKEICGQAENSIMPGYVGIEAGQAAFGDVYAWLKEILLWPLKQLLPSSGLLTEAQKNALSEEFSAKIIPEITARCQAMPDDEADLIALDWFNGRRYPLVNEHVTGAVAGLQLGTTVPHLYKALVLATAFGSRRILESFLAEGLSVERIITVGGIAQKSPFVMQTLANVLNRSISVSASTQACAKGAAMYAAVAAGVYNTLQDAQAAMSEGFLSVYIPEKERVERYNELYQKYLRLGEFVEHETLSGKEKPGDRCF